MFPWITSTWIFAFHVSMPSYYSIPAWKSCFCHGSDCLGTSKEFHSSHRQTLNSLSPAFFFRNLLHILFIVTEFFCSIYNDLILFSTCIAHTMRHRPSHLQWPIRVCWSCDWIQLRLPQMNLAYFRPSRHPTLSPPIHPLRSQPKLCRNLIWPVKQLPRQPHKRIWAAWAVARPIGPCATNSRSLPSTVVWLPTRPRSDMF